MNSVDGKVVEEVPGLFGPFQFPEILLQRIWAERSFSGHLARTLAGVPIKILNPGRWNRQAGPDFRQAELRIGDRVCHGDVELHLREPDWAAHGHAADPEYDEVMLHVVLFPSKRVETPGAGGRKIPVLVLLPLLWHDLEEYAADAAVAAMADRPADRVAQAWMELSAEAGRERIVQEARKRWRSKVGYAGLRIKKLGWASACHHGALEILGYRFNRAPMLTVATRWPLDSWIAGDADVTEIYAEMAEQWKLGAVRPANRPQRRLAAYAQWVAAGGDWPTSLGRVGADWPQPASRGGAERDVAELRRELVLKAWWREVMLRLGIEGAVGQPRADNLWGDGLLPWLCAGGHLNEEIGFQWWFMSWPGDQAANLTAAAKLIGVSDGRRNPLAWGHVQGLLGHQLAVVQADGEGDLTTDFARG